jgi:3-methyladenine DNA glycosylase AlkD
MTPVPILRDQILAELVQQADPTYRDLVHRRYNMDVSSFLGVRTPVIHQIASRHYKALKPLPVDERLAACHLLLEAGTYELKIAAFRWAHLCRNDLHAAHLPVLAGWLDSYVDDWIDCDDLCIHVLGEFFLRHPALAQETRAWTDSANRWVRRGAAVALVLPARRGQQLALAFDIADLLLADADDLVQKAYGWLLKEASKVHPHEVFRYVVERRDAMPRIAFRYALEKLPGDLRRAAMAAD